MNSVRRFLHEGGIALTFLGVLAAEGVFCAVAALNGLALFYRAQIELVYYQREDGMDKRSTYPKLHWWVRALTRTDTFEGSVARETIGGYDAGAWPLAVAASVHRKAAWAHIVILGLARFAAGLPLVPSFVYGG